jgi:hypothetical protein
LDPSAEEEDDMRATPTHRSRLAVVRAAAINGQFLPLSSASPSQVGVGHFEIVSGTDTYARLAGNRTFQIVADANANQLIETEIANLRG